MSDEHINCIGQGDSMSYPTPMDVAESEDREAMTDPFADELAKCSVLYTQNLVAEREALIAELATAKARLAEAMRLLAKEGIHMDDHGCWCNPSVTNYGDACTRHLDDGPEWRVDCPAHGFAREEKP